MFRVVMASNPDRDDLVAEVSHLGEIFAVVSKGRDGLQVELFPPPPQSSRTGWTFDLQEFQAVIAHAARQFD
jgi:hypothetical protein